LFLTCLCSILFPYTTLFRSGLLVGQFAFAFFGYGLSHYPYLLYPHLTIYDSFTNEAMAISLVVAFVLGLALLLPSLYLLMRLFLFNMYYVKGSQKNKD